MGEQIKRNWSEKFFIILKKGWLNEWLRSYSSKKSKDFLCIKSHFLIKLGRFENLWHIIVKNLRNFNVGQITVRIEKFTVFIQI